MNITRKPMVRAWTVAAAFVLTSTTLAAGSVSRYYLTDGDVSVLQVAQSGAIVDSWTTDVRLYPLAVADTVRLYARGAFAYEDGIEYTLEGVPTGVTFPWQAGPTGQLLDGGTDAVTHNYANERGGGQGIWQYDLDWKNPVRLFTTTEQTNGITYDRVAETLWISQEFGDIQQVALDGTVLSHFDPDPDNPFARWGALAWEPATDTLWANRSDSEVFRQWAKDGTLLQEVVVTGLSATIWGGEFAMVDEFLLGDVNLDGNVNGLDVGPFVDVLINGPYQIEADTNQDQVVNGLDVEPFVAILVGGGAQVVPEPTTGVLAAIGLLGMVAFGRRR